jgi:hypothetical protein
LLWITSGETVDAAPGVSLRPGPLHLRPLHVEVDDWQLALRRLRTVS